MAEREGMTSVDWTPKEVIGDELDRIRGALAEQLPGYTLALDFIPADNWQVTLADEDIGPTWDALVAHARVTVDSDTIDEGVRAVAHEVVNEESDLRLYPVWRDGESNRTVPYGVVIAWRGGNPLVIGIG